MRQRALAIYVHARYPQFAWKRSNRLARARTPAHLNIASRVMRTIHFALQSVFNLEASVGAKMQRGAA